MYGLKQMLLQEKNYLDNLVSRLNETMNVNAGVPAANAEGNKASKKGSGIVRDGATISGTENGGNKKNSGATKSGAVIDDTGVAGKVRGKKATECNVFPEGRLRISMDHGVARYYHCVDDRLGYYIPKKNKQLPRQLAQKAYNDSVIKVAVARSRLIDRFLKGYCDDEIERQYEELHPERRALITPVAPTLSQMEALWYEESYVGKAFKEDAPVILTEKGERVRSKSEKILADFFYRNNILYKYEKPLNLGGLVVYPDFTFFSRKLKKEIYWEHEGMMDKQDYARAAVKKINSYQMNGIYPGERLIMTFETEQDVLNSKIVSELVERYLR